MVIDIEMLVRWEEKGIWGTFRLTFDSQRRWVCLVSELAVLFLSIIYCMKKLNMYAHRVRWVEKFARALHYTPTTRKFNTRRRHANRYIHKMCERRSRYIDNASPVDRRPCSIVFALYSNMSFSFSHAHRKSRQCSSGTASTCRSTVRSIRSAISSGGRT